MNKVFLYSYVFVFSIFVSSVSQVLLKKSTFRQYKSRINEYMNSWVIIAYIMFFSSTLLTMLAYRYVPLSMGPILESTGYIFVSVLGVVFLKEKISKRKLLGMIIICLGVIVCTIT